MADIFRFKQFDVDHSTATMKVGTDGVLLGAWARPSKAKHILDIGTGCGVIALMLAQRTSDTVTVDAIDIDPVNCSLADSNFKASPWSSRLKCIHTSVQNFNPSAQYDCIVSNPPFFINSAKPPGEGRTTARHTVTLSYLELITAAVRLLSPQGSFSVILPFSSAGNFIDQVHNNNLFLARHCVFKSRKDKPVERLLLEFKREQTTPYDQEEIVLYESGDKWTEGYQKLTGDFYLDK